MSQAAQRMATIMSASRKMTKPASKIHANFQLETPSPLLSAASSTMFDVSASDPADAWNATTSAATARPSTRRPRAVHAVAEDPCNRGQPQVFG